MSAHRLRPANPLDEAGLIEVLFYGPSAPFATRSGRVWVPPTDVYETEDQIVVLVEIAGVRHSDFAVSLVERRLTVTGVRIDRGMARRAYYQMEVQFGEFRVELDLPLAVDENAVTAEYSEGFLRILLPKKRPQAIDVQE
jgi:HSP20 family protein